VAFDIKVVPSYETDDIKSIAFDVAVKVGAVPPGHLNAESNVNVPAPPASWVT